MTIHKPTINTLTIVLALFVSNGATAASVTRQSISTTGVEANGSSTFGATSSDGRYVAFATNASNIVANDNNFNDDIFLRDRQLGTTIRVSVGANGVEANSASARPCISANGRYVGFESSASNLIASDTNGTTDVFVYDTLNATTSRASVATGGVQGNGASIQCAISSDGRYVAFNSVATNLVSGDTNGYIDTFVHDMTGNTTERVSVSSSGAQGNNKTRAEDAPAISSDGRYVAFRSSASNLVSSDTNSAPDIFVRDRSGKTTTRVSVTNSGSQSNGWSYAPSISAAGGYVVFQSDATNLVSSDTNAVADVFVRDLTAKTTKRVSVSSTSVQANGYSTSPSISSDGRYVAFTSAATNLVSGDTNAVNDIFLRDMTAGTTTLVSIGLAGATANDYSGAPQISSNGSFVLFSSGASNVVSGDTNQQWDMFVYAR